MTCYSVIKSRLSGNSLIEMRSGSILAVGAAVGGLVGKELFDRISSVFANQNMVGAVQAACLMLITVWTLVCTVRKDRLHTCVVKHPVPIFLIGSVLGIFSSFLGIGGGPINVALIIYLFSFDTKTATVCSLVTILFAQISKLATVALTTGFAVFDLSIAPVMIVGAIAGGFIGASLNKKCSEAAVEKAFNAVQLVVLAIAVFNIVRNLMA